LPGAPIVPGGCRGAGSRPAGRAGRELVKVRQPTHDLEHATWWGALLKKWTVTTLKRSPLVRPRPSSPSKNRRFETSVSATARTRQKSRSRHHPRAQSPPRRKWGRRRPSSRHASRVQLPDALPTLPPFQICDRPRRVPAVKEGGAAFGGWRNYHPLRVEQSNGAGGASSAVTGPKPSPGKAGPGTAHTEAESSNICTGTAHTENWQRAHLQRNCSC
jgi:hypothetical protein